MVGIKNQRERLTQCNQAFKLFLNKIGKIGHAGQYSKELFKFHPIWT